MTTAFEEYQQMTAELEFLRAQLAEKNAEVARLEAQLKAEAERADYAWRNTRLIEKDRQQLLERLQSCEQRCKLLEHNVPAEVKNDAP